MMYVACMLAFYIPVLPNPFWLRVVGVTSSTGSNSHGCIRDIIIWAILSPSFMVMFWLPRLMRMTIISPL